ncbi:MAG: outer membrane beta-barrel protein [Rhizobiaceae bacterium]|nr:outer membrane beta-barrel protein [Rhizobiaceae bacterium]
MSLPLAVLALGLGMSVASAQDVVDLRGSIDNAAETPDAAQEPPPRPSPAPARETGPVTPTSARQEVQPRTLRVQPLTSGAVPLRQIEDDPFAPAGLRAGSFIIRPSVETGILATSNATSSPDGDDAIVSQSTLRLNAVSDRDIDQAEFNAFGTFEKSLAGEELNQKEAGIDATLVRELAGDYRLRGFAAYAIRPESFDSPVEIVGAVDQPIQQSLIGSAELLRDAGKLRLGLGGDIDREWYGDAELPDGTSVSQKDRDNTLATARLRAGYAISPALTPFAELRGGRRDYDERLDAAGYVRSADHIEGRIGLAFDRGEKFRGEFAAGYVRENLDDERLDPIEGLSVNANIDWSPVRDTNVNLLGTTEVEGTTTPGLSGSILYSSLLTVERRMRSNLTASLAAGIGYRDYQPGSDHDMIYTAELAATWWLNRYLGLTAEARHENVNSTIEGRDSSTNSIYLGIKAQR